MFCPSVFRPLFLLPLCLLAACASLPSVGPEHAVPALSTPERWSAMGGGDVAGDAGVTAGASASGRLARWWQQFDDALLDELIEKALAGSTDLRQAQARVRQARALRLQAEAAFLPSLSASAGRSRSQAARTASADSAVPPAQTLYEAGFDAAWEIDLFGGTRRAAEAAAADLAASEAVVDAARVSLVADLVGSYIDWRSGQQRLAIARDNLASQAETLRLVDWRAQAGLASASDVAQARGNFEQTRAGIPDLEVALAGAGNRLAVLTGQAPGALHARLAEALPLPAAPAALAAGIPADVLRQRPDLIAAERTLAAETARVGQALAERFPSLSLGGSLGWQAFSLGALGGSGTLLHTLRGTLAATLFDGGRLRAAVAAQDAVQAQALLAYEAAVLGALEEVENALVAHAFAHERLAARRAAAEAAGNAARLTGTMYRAGLSDLQKVLETERTRLSAEDARASAEATLLASLVRLYKALGGGWEAQAGAGRTTAEGASAPAADQSQEKRS